MKKSFLIVILSIGFITAKAQGALQFNQVLLISASQTVPAGKVWKVMSVPTTNALVPPTGSSYQTISKIISVNGNNLVIARSTKFYSANSAFNSETASDVSIANPTELPLWLPAGTTVAPGTNANFINVIEFNIL